VQRLDPDAIPYQHQRVSLRVPERYAEHSAKTREAVLAPFFVGVNDGLGVGVGVEAVTAGTQVVAQLAIVVDFAVEDDPDRAVFIANRLMTAREVDDAQPSHPQRDTIVHEHTFIVRTPMPDDLAHSVHDRLARVRLIASVAIEIRESRYTAHRREPPWFR
jgi:hypothetical protein